MPELIEKGYVYIAQPPLYKITRNKKDVYCKDDDAKNEYLLSIAAERTTLFGSGAGAQALSGEQVKALLKKVITYETRLQRMALRYDTRVVDALVQAGDIEAETLGNVAALNDQLEKVEAFLDAHYPEFRDFAQVKPETDPEHSNKRLVILSEVNGSPRRTVVDTSFLSSSEYRDLREVKEAFASLGAPPFRMEIDGNAFEATTWQQILKRGLDDAQTGLTMQRYKGLGEMNPDQLKETTMDPARRTLKQVKVTDAVEAENWFSTLMGEDVERRRLFIEQNARNANLDV